MNINDIYIKIAEDLGLAFKLDHYLFCDEYGDGLLLAELCRCEYLFDRSEKQWYRFNGHVWVPEKVNQIFCEVDRVIEIYAQVARNLHEVYLKSTDEAERKDLKEKKELWEKRIYKLQTVKRRNNVILAASSGTESLGISGEEWDRDKGLIACKSGILDIITGVLRPGRPLDYFRRQINTEWHGIDAPCPIFDKFLNDIFNGDPELVAFTLRLLGYSLVGSSKEHILVMFYGKGRNGKDTLMDILGDVLGDLVWSIQSEMLLASNHSRSSASPSPDILELRGRRIVYCSESEEGRNFNTARAKSMSGGGKLSGRGLYQQKGENFSPTHTIFFLTNTKPKVRVNDYAFWQRVLLINFRVSFVDKPKHEFERKVDKHIREKMQQERPGILARLIRGARDWHDRGLQIPESIRNATDKYRANEDTVKQFIDDCCSVGPEKSVGVMELYTAYKAWCDGTCKEAIKMAEFNDYVGEQFKRQGRQASGYKFNGLGLE